MVFGVCRYLYVFPQWFFLNPAPNSMHRARKTVIVDRSEILSDQDADDPIPASTLIQHVIAHHSCDRTNVSESRRCRVRNNCIAHGSPDCAVDVCSTKEMVSKDWHDTDHNRRYEIYGSAEGHVPPHELKQPLCKLPE